jgi:uncharacterized protein (DUF885 family)
MQRRDFILSGVATAVAATLSRRAFADAPSGEAARARALYDAIFEQTLIASPQGATTLGLDTGRNAALRSKLDDRSPAGRMGALGPIADALPQLRGIDRARLEGRDRIDYDSIAWLSGISHEIAAQPVGRTDNYGYPVPYTVSQLTGAYQSTPDFLASQHPVETVADAEAFIARLEDFARQVDFDTARTLEDTRRAFLPPDFIVDKTLLQLKRLRSQPGAQSPMTQSLVTRTEAKRIGGDWGPRAARIIDGPLARALDAQIAAVAAQRPRTTSDPGVRSRPDGEAYYPLCLRYQTSTRLTPNEAHDVGLAQVAELSAEADRLLAKQGYTQGTVGARLAALTQDPRFLYPNTDAGRAELLADLNRQIEAIRTRLPRVFATLPRTPVEVRRVPPEIELGAPRGYAQLGSLDGSRPGAYYINLANTAIWPKWALTTLTYHESLPGHHLQGTLALEATDTPMLNRTLPMNAYVEGWGLYAEQLADEIGMYDDFPLGRIGMLQSFIYRAVRIVVDTGMHWKGWSRARAADYMESTVGLARPAVESEIDRYCVWPGQATGYKIGHLEFLRLRESAKARLGPRFDLTRFHDAVLSGGPVPLEVLERVVDDWATQRAAGRSAM